MKNILIDDDKSMPLIGVFKSIYKLMNPDSIWEDTKQSKIILQAIADTVQVVAECNKGSTERKKGSVNVNKETTDVNKAVADIVQVTSERNKGSAE